MHDPLRPHCRGSTWAETKRAPRLSVSAELHETPVHHHDPSSASGGPHLLSVAQLPHVKRAARFQRKLKRPRGALGRCAWGCGFIPAWHASSARSRRAVRAAIDHFAAVDQSGSAPHVRLLNTRYRGDFVALPSRWAPRHVAQEGPLYRVFKSRTGASVADATFLIGISSRWSIGAAEPLMLRTRPSLAPPLPGCSPPATALPRHHP